MPDIFGFFIGLELTPSDIVLLLCVPVAAWFWVSYALGSPWYRSWLGVVTFLHSMSVACLLFLIVYAIVFQQRVDEPWRLMVATLLFFALTSKVVILHIERRAGNIERRRRRILQHMKGTS